MRASYQGSEILNNFSKKLAQFFAYFYTNCRFETLSFSKKRVTTVTHINLPVTGTFFLACTLLWFTLTKI